MAEALLKQLGGDTFDVESAGIEPGNLNPLAIEVLKEIGIDISKNKTKSAFELYKQGKLYHFVVTVCDEASAEKCPIFPGITKRLHWGFEDPSAFQGTWEEKFERTRNVRNTIETKIENWLQSIKHSV